MMRMTKHNLLIINKITIIVLIIKQIFITPFKNSKDALKSSLNKQYYINKQIKGKENSYPVVQ